MTQPTCHLSRLILRRYRSHPVFDGAFDSRPVAIHGPNGAGKTNILEAVSQLSPGRGLRGAAAEEAAGRPDPIGWSVEARAETVDGPFAAQVTVDLSQGRGGARRAVRIDDAAASQTELGRRLRQVWLTPAMDRLWIEGASERRRFLDRTTLAFDPSHGERAARYERAMRDRNRLLKEDRWDPAWIEALEDRMAIEGAQIFIARTAALERLSAAQAAAETAFPKADFALEGDLEALAAEMVPAEVEDHLRRGLAEGRRRDAAAGRALLGPHRADLAARYTAKDAPARECSTGEQKALLISAVLATARALKALIGAPPVLLLDEIAAHLDAGRRAALFDEICALGAQAWMTAAGAEIFDPLDDRAQRIALG